MLAVAPGGRKGYGAVTPAPLVSADEPHPRAGAIAAMSFPVDRTGPPLIGVRGWLLLLCVILTVISPLVVLAGSARPLHHVLVGGMTARQAVAILADVLARFAVAGYGVYAGYRLWAIRPGAVATAKLYFALKLCFAVVWPWLFLEIVNVASNRIFLIGWIGGIIGAFILFVVWYFYLLKSRRVANTYFGAA